MSYLPESLKFILNYTAGCTLVGSRVTCNPPPTDTDQDVLVFCIESKFDELELVLGQEGYDHDGDDHYPNPRETDMSFKSFSNGEINLIVTCSPEFHRQFMAAHSIAKRLNLLDKNDRVALFQPCILGVQ